MSIYNHIEDPDTGEKLSPTRVLRAWGRCYMDTDGTMQMQGAWSNASMEWKLMRFGHGAKEAGRKPELTGPESAMYRLRKCMDIALWADPILKAQGLTGYRAAVLYFAHEFTLSTIALEIGCTEDEARNKKKACVSAVSRAVNKLLEDSKSGPLTLAYHSCISGAT